MRRKCFVALAAALVLVTPITGSAAEKRTRNVVNNPSHIRSGELHGNAFAKAMNDNNLEQIVALYAKRAVLYPTDTSEVRGRAAIRQAYKKLLDANAVTDFHYVDREYDAIGTTTLGWGRWAMTLAPKNGGPAVQTEGRFTSFSVLAGRKWYFVFDHISVPVPAAAPAAAPSAAPAEAAPANPAP